MLTWIARRRARAQGAKRDADYLLLKYGGSALEVAIGRAEGHLYPHAGSPDHWRRVAALIRRDHDQHVVSLPASTTLSRG